MIVGVEIVKKVVFEFSDGRMVVVSHRDGTLMQTCYTVEPCRP